jgi:hypothetical protein
MQLADLPVPSTPVTAATAEALRRYSPPAFVNHCVRSYLFAVALATQDEVDVDVELLYVASLLHDLALEPVFDSATVPFEQAGGELVWLITAGAGWSPGRREHAAGVVVAHMQGADPEVDPEGHLLELATGLDISGRNVSRWPAALLREIVAAHPRLDLAPRFTACFRDQAARKPTSTAARAIENGLADRLVANPLEQL